MTTKGFAVAASDVGGAFVKDLATELGKSASTLTSYLRKHLPSALVKRKNSNNRLANFCTADGVAGLRAHYSPKYAEVPNDLAQELERLRAENERLRARVEELESIEEAYVMDEPQPKVIRNLRLHAHQSMELIKRTELEVINMGRKEDGLPLLDYKQLEEIYNGEQSRARREKSEARKQATERREAKVVELHRKTRE